MRTTSPSPPAGASAGSAGSLLAAAVGLLLGLVTLIGLVKCVLRQHRRGSRSARSAHADEVPLAEGEQPWFETSIYVEDDDLSCDFTMRVEHAELQSRELLLECIARAAFEATEIAFDFEEATLERLELHSDAHVIKTDADCRRLWGSGAAGLRVTCTGGRTPRGKAATRTAPARLGSLLHGGGGEEDGDEREIELIL